MSVAETVLTVIGLMLVVEGLLYAAFPNTMRQAVAWLVTQPERTLLVGGIVAALGGIALIWLGQAVA